MTSTMQTKKAQDNRVSTKNGSYCEGIKAIETATIGEAADYDNKLPMTEECHLKTPDRHSVVGGKSKHHEHHVDPVPEKDGTNPHLWTSGDYDDGVDIQEFNRSSSGGSHCEGGKSEDSAPVGVAADYDNIQPRTEDRHVKTSDTHSITGGKRARHEYLSQRKMAPKPRTIKAEPICWQGSFLLDKDDAGASKVNAANWDGIEEVKLAAPPGEGAVIPLPPPGFPPPPPIINPREGK